MRRSVGFGRTYCVVRHTSGDIGQAVTQLKLSDYWGSNRRGADPVRVFSVVVGCYCLLVLQWLLVPHSATATNTLPAVSSATAVMSDTVSGSGKPLASHSGIDFRHPPVLARSLLSKQSSNKPLPTATGGEPDSQRTSAGTTSTDAAPAFAANFEALTAHSAVTLITSNQFSGSLTPASAYAQSVTALPPITPDHWLAFAPMNSTDEGLHVVLDPGHGGSDPGTVGPIGQTEKVLTLAIAKRVQSILHQRSTLRVSLTRSRDYGLSRRDRINSVSSKRGDLLVSLHLNNLPQQHLTLVESFYAGPENILESLLHKTRPGRTESVAAFQSHTGDAFLGNGSTHPITAASLQRLASASRHLAGTLQNHVHNTVQQYNPSAVDAGIKTDTLYMLTRSDIPSALIELTCLSNAEENERLNTASYREALAEALARGIVEYFSDVQSGTDI